MNDKDERNRLKVNFTIRLTKDESDWLRKRAKKEIRPVAGLLRKIIANYRAEHEDES